MEDNEKTHLRNAINTLGAKRVEDGDYCRQFQEIIRVGESKTKICDNCPIRCVHSGSKLEEDNLVKNKNK